MHCVRVSSRSSRRTYCLVCHALHMPLSPRLAVLQLIHQSRWVCSVAARPMSSFGLVPLPAISRLTSRVWRILGLNPGPYTLQGTNTYLVGTGASRLLIDTGAGVRGYVDNVVECMRQSGCERLEAILVTHWHHDHTGGLADLLAYFASPAAALSRSSSPVSPIGTASSLGSTTSTEDSSPASTHSFTASQPPATLAAIPVYKHQTHMRGAAPPALTYLPLSPTSRFAVEGATLSCVATPGHTADHVSFLLDEEHAMFIGDTVLGHGTTVFRHLYDYTHTLQSVSRMAPLVLYPGHGAEVADVQGKLAEYLQHRRMREQQLLRLLRQHNTAATALELVTKVYPPLSDAVLPAAIQNVTLHLEKLALEGDVACEQMEADKRESGGGGGGGKSGLGGGDLSDGEGGGEEWQKEYGELYESTSAMVQRKSQWKWTAVTNRNGSL